MANADQIERLRGLESFLNTRLLGQDQVIARAAAVFTRGELGLARKDRPRGTFLAVGPTGTGKTELVLLTARYLWGESQVCRFDLSEYQREDAIERLLGANSQDGGAMGRAAPVASPRVWLFDEMEKAHPKVFDLFIQILEPGCLTLATGEKISFQDDYVAFTSNVGSAESMRMTRSNRTSVEQAVLRRVGETLRPEFVARIPDQLVFDRLTPSIQRKIAQLHLANEVARMRSVGHDLVVSQEALEFLIREGFHSHLGARPLRQTIERHLQNAVVRGLFEKGTGSGRIAWRADENQIELE